MKRILAIVVLLFSILSLILCAKDHTQTNDMPDMKVKAENWNTSIKLRDDPVIGNSFKNGQDLTLRVENLSNTPIVFLENFGLRVMTNNGPNWTDVQSNFYNGGLQYLPTKSSYPLGLFVSALPYMPNLSSPITTRIVIIGHKENDDKELLGAYLDVKLNP